MDSSNGPLTATGVDFNNPISARRFLRNLLNGRPFHEINTSIRAIYWYGIAIVIVVATLYNLYVKVLTWSRLRAVRLNHHNSTEHTSTVAKITLSIVAFLREVSYLQIFPSRLPFKTAPPNLGILILCVVYLGWILGLQFYQVEYPGAQHYTSLGLRAAWISVLQLPLLILLAGKENLIGHLTGVSYERLNVLHRWIARIIWLTATLHWAYLQFGWSQYDGLNRIEMSTDKAYSLGVVAWSLLTWINISSFSIIRNLHYEFFVCQHIITWIGFIIVVAMHVPNVQARIYVYIAIGIFIFDRLSRSLRFIKCNFPIGRATITALPGNVSRITVQSSGLRSWRNGQHVFLSIPHFGWSQSHPATILSTPQSHRGDLVFILKAHQGFTARCLASAYSTMPLLPDAKGTSTSKNLTEIPSASEMRELALPPNREYIALLSGPHGGSHIDYASFTSVLLVAGSTGVTYTLPILLGIVERAQMVALPVRQISFVWIIKSFAWTVWIEEELQCVIDRMILVGIRCDIQIFVTGKNSNIESNLRNTDSITSNMADRSISQSDKAIMCDKCHNAEAACACGKDEDTTSSSSPPLDEKEAMVKSETESQPAPVVLISSSETTTFPAPGPSEEKPTANLTMTGVECSKISSIPQSSGWASGVHTFATVRHGRPIIENLIRDEFAKTQEEMGVGVCGPTSLSVGCRQAAAKISREQRTAKGISGAPCIYLHVEGFGW